MKNTGKEEIAHKIYEELGIEEDILDDCKDLILDEIVYSLSRCGFFKIFGENSLQQ